jgi:LacI family transcriptional regulator
MSESVDRFSDRRYSAGFLAGVTDASVDENDRISPLICDAPNRSLFAKWLENKKPDVVITDREEVMAWMEIMNINVPETIGLIHLDWSPVHIGWAGMRQNGKLVGAAAADLVIGQITNNETGIPVHPRLVLIESDFVPGPSVKGGGADISEDSFDDLNERRAAVGSH